MKRGTGTDKKHFHEGETHPKHPPTQIKAQFAQTISGQFVQTYARKSLGKLFVQTVFLFGWVVFGVGCLPLKFVENAAFCCIACAPVWEFPLINQWFWAMGRCGSLSC